MKLIFSLFLSVFLLGCAAAGVPYTNDPKTKLYYAYQLMNIEGRGLAAEKLGLEALSKFEKENNIIGIAEAHTFLGSYYKSYSYRQHKSFYERFNEYDRTASKSIAHFEKSVEAFKKDSDYWGVSKATFSMGNAYATDKDFGNACAKYEGALEIYQSHKIEITNKGRSHSYRQIFESYDAMIEAFIKKYCSK
jgi:tetratricopeptide (TPR) repeat protein